jgi:hypothetical protein
MTEDKTIFDLGKRGRRCAYCGKSEKLTREDIFAVFLQKSNPTYRTYLDHHRRRRLKGKMPVVRDVCRTCNNEALSPLDSYAAGLDRKYFSATPAERATVVFRYDYHLLLRWLLKAWYNDARATPRNVEEHRLFVPYILGQVREPPSPVALFVGRLARFETAKHPRTSVPAKALRFGTTYSPNVKVANNLVMARMLSLNSYLFHLFVWRAGIGRHERREFARGLEAEWKFRELRAHQKEIELVESKVDTLNYLNARTTSGGALRRRGPSM